MSDSLAFAALVALAIGACCFLRAVTNWQKGLSLVVLTLFFGGIVGVNAGSAGAAILFRDVFVVLPLYLGFFGTHAGGDAISRIPPALLGGLLLLLISVFISALVPTDASVAMIAVGVKVWVWYLPFVAVGVAVGMRPILMMRLMRFILVAGLIASLVGLTQGLLVRIVGYEPAIALFFGSHAKEVTQDFAFFDYAGGIYRIPGTFSYVAQYGYFLYFFVCAATLVANTDPEERVRKMAKMALALSVFAAAFCGLRFAILAVPAMLLMFSVFGLFDRRMLAGVPVVVVIAMVVFAATGLDPVEYFSRSSDLAASYGPWVEEQIAGGFSGGLLGMGLGKTTLAARYVAPDIEIIGIESYIGKIGVELGAVGLIVCGILAAMIVFCIVGVLLKHSPLGRAYRFVMPLGTYIALTLAMSIKGSPFDSDPSCIMFWLSLGMIIGVDRYYLLEPSQASSVLDVAQRIADFSVSGPNGAGVE